jgi:hypothetical protein
MFSLPGFLFVYFQQDQNPFSNQPMASPQSNLKLYRFMIKLLLPVYLILNYNGSYNRFYELSTCIVYLQLMVLRFTSPSFYNQSVDQLMLSSDIMLFWTSFCCSIHAFLDPGQVDNLGLVFLIAGYPMVRYSFLNLLNKSKI